MPLIRVKDLVPDVYESTSRDFQLISNLKTCVFSATKEDIDSIVDIINTEHCPDRLLPLLQSRLGFITDKEFDNRTLRIALSVFPYLIKNKGTLKAIKQAVYAFLKINNLNTRTYVEVNNKVDYGYVEKDLILSDDKELSIPITPGTGASNVIKLPEKVSNLTSVEWVYKIAEEDEEWKHYSYNIVTEAPQPPYKYVILSDDGMSLSFGPSDYPGSTGSSTGQRLVVKWSVQVTDSVFIRKYADNKQPYTIKIGIESTPRDITILKELFKYILPPGYDISFFFFSGVDEGLTTDKLIFNDSAEVITVGDGINSAALSYDESAQYDIVAKHIVAAGDTFETIKYEDREKVTIKVEKKDTVQNNIPDVVVKTKSKRGRKKKVNKDAN